jgi:hypothetical protein
MHKKWPYGGQIGQVAAKLLGLARTIYIRCICGTFGREITKYTVIYGAYIRFWPTLIILDRHTQLSTIWGGELL